MGNETSLIFCDNCCYLALAEYDNQYLCSECLLKEMTLDPDSFFEDNVKPLQINEAMVQRFSRTEDANSHPMDTPR